LLRRVVSSITALMMAAASTSETPVYFYQTAWRNIPEDSHLQQTVCFSGNSTMNYYQ
jgi:hypothetical protein